MSGFERKINSDNLLGPDRNKERLMQCFLFLNKIKKYGQNIFQILILIV